MVLHFDLVALGLVVVGAGAVALHGVDHEVDEVVPPRLGLDPVPHGLRDGVHEEPRGLGLEHGELDSVEELFEPGYEVEQYSVKGEASCVK